MNPDALWQLFDRVSGSVAAAVAAADRTASGGRPGQYRLDLDADAVVVAPLLEAGLGVLSEESGRHGVGRTITVVVDPVDGSTNASRGLPCWATSLCAVDDAGAFVATVVDQSRNITYRAARGRGATRQVGGGLLESIGVAAPVALADSVLAINGLSADRPASWQFRALGSAAIELCLVADGSLDGYINLDPNSHGSWDYLGAALVLAEAGGVAVDRADRPLVTLDHGDRRTIAASSCEALLEEMMKR